VREVMIVAGETSGDLHAAGLAAALKARHPDWRLTGMGGARMVAAGVDVAERTDTTAVMGFVEVLRTIPRHYALLKTLGRRLEEGAVKCLVTIDYPGFNLRLAAAARKAGVPVVYYITPQVWAWGADRLPKMAQLITKAAVILPFEEELLRRHGIDFDIAWLEPFLEFRFPLVGEVEMEDVRLEVRNAIEPWHVLGEEVAGSGTAVFGTTVNFALNSPVVTQPNPSTSVGITVTITEKVLKLNVSGSAERMCTVSTRWSMSMRPTMFSVSV